MKCQASDDAQKATTKCERGFACLKEDGKPHCPVKDCINNQVYFVKCPDGKHCPYQHSFGTEHFCVCPIRKELFNKHKI